MNNVNNIKYISNKNQVLNWDLINKFDYKYGTQNKLNINIIKVLANNIKYSKLLIEDILKIKDNKLIKLFQISQILLEKLTIPEVKSYEKLKKLILVKKKIEEFKNEKYENIKKNDCKLTKLRYKINNKIQILKQLKDNYNLIQYKKCVLCNKIFENLSYLEKHFLKRHKYDLVEYSHYNKIKLINKDVIRNFKILKERIINKNRLKNKKNIIDDQKIIKKETIFNEKKNPEKQNESKNIKILNTQKNKIKKNYESKIDILESEIHDYQKKIYGFVDDRNNTDLTNKEININQTNNEFLDNQIEINQNSFWLKKFIINKKNLDDYNIEELNELFKRIKIIKKSKIERLNELKLIPKYNNLYNSVIVKKTDNTMFFKDYDEQELKKFYLKYNKEKNNFKKKITLNINDDSGHEKNINKTNSINKESYKKYIKKFDFEENEEIEKKDNINYFKSKNSIFEEDPFEEENNFEETKIIKKYNIKEINQDLFDFY